MSQFIEKFKRVHWNEILDIWKLPISAICVPIYRIKHKNLWIICEDKMEARDNGYWFFKYVNEKHPEQECVYAISNDSVDYKKISKIGKTVEYGSLRHWILYLASTRKISSQKAGNPNAAIFYFLEVYGLLKDTRIFLQHGIIKDDLKWLYYDVTKMKRFICGAFPEYEFVCNTFGYPEGAVQYTGLCRFDGLHNFKIKRQILIMPTWREWIADEDYRLKKYEGTIEIPKTNYFIKWNSFLNSAKLKELSEKYNVKFIFFPHRNMQKYMQYFPKGNEYLSVMSGKDIDIQKILRESALMITDYSSVFFDFFYMKKPVIFYQFDYDIFRKGQYGEGYFNYRKNPFANSYSDLLDVFNEIELIVKQNFTISDEYKKAHQIYFPAYDTNNCMRIYQVTCKIN
ncbi:MAG: CDP-glycerol glycerophosphotransferase family protein [Oscillospiraceae bacterium]|nr:CDP-glycerol glycerophosphotransferase family protein [Oscillospiraceae bacterium]